MSPSASLPPEADCPLSAEIPSWLQGELSADRAERIASHVVVCAECQQERDDYESLLAALGANPGDSASEDHLDGIVRNAVATSFSGRLLGRGVAVILGLILVAAWLSWLVIADEPQSPTDQAASLPSPESILNACEESRRWLIANRAVDGAWESRGDARGDLWRQRRTGLCLLALVQGSTGVSERYVPAIEAASSWLQERAAGEGAWPPAQFLESAPRLGLAAVRQLQQGMGASPLRASSQALAAQEALLQHLGRELWGISRQDWGSPSAWLPRIWATRVAQGNDRGSFRPVAGGPYGGDRVISTAAASLLLAHVAATHF